MSDVSTFRLYLLRAMYLFTAVGLAIVKLPALLHPENLSPTDSVILSVLGATALLAVLGIRYPLKMLPMLFFEFVWKSIWILAFGLPQLLSGRLDPNVSFGGTEKLIACLVGVVLVPLVMPWGYVLKHYLEAPGDPWGEQVTPSTPRQVIPSTPKHPSSSPVVSEGRVVTGPAAAVGSRVEQPIPNEEDTRR
jgi:hypothetical protein